MIILKNFFNIGFSIFIKFLAIFIGIFTNRWLVDPSHISPLELAEFNLITVYNGIILGMLTFGIPTLVQKFYTNEKDHTKYPTFWSTILFIQLFLYLVGVVFILVVCTFFSKNDLFLFLGLYTLQYILLIDGNFRSICDVFGRSWQFSLTDFLSKLILFIFLVASTYFSFSVKYINYFIAISIIIYIIQFFSDWIWQKKYTPLSKIDLSLISSNINFYIYIGLTGILISLYSTTDRWFINYFGYSEFVLNGYVIAYKILETILVIPALSVPIIASLAKKEVDTYVSKKNPTSSKFLTQLKNFLTFTDINNADIIYIYTKWLAVSLLIGILSSLGLFVVKDIAIGIIDGQRTYFNYASGSLSILLLALIPIGVSLYCNIVLIFLNREKQTFFIIVFIAIFTIMLYYLLISRYGHIGAGLASVISIFTDTTIRVIFLYKNIKDKYSKIFVSTLESNTIQKAI
jgi:O-antigen/teichoic acid export membrane protein